MVDAYILIEVKPGTEIQVREKLERMKEVKSVEAVYGDYDLISKVTVRNMQRLQEFITKKLRSIKDITSTTTMICLE
ncbi:MAG TPA: Lrp/AsnC family transcriptional regulator [Candidatus Aenigmarchaeota archaeon]|nr:Lrp/AsnC family transcriptional regulator [Candidatus Aenigmarchaeota archaeon]HEX32979.1 Lrp/AsnC family transcriptional regulator [Candidatus Aenigmarchaeota archaeon]